MAALALRTSAFANGVSELHGEVSRAAARQPTCPALPEHEVPIGHVTNGVHTRSCVSREMAGLFDRYLGARLVAPARRRRDLGGRSTRSPTRSCGAPTSGAASAWSPSPARRLAAPARAARRLRRATSTGPAASSTPAPSPSASPAASPPTSGPTCSCATSTGSRRILLDPERPVQIIFAGKAHPKDREGKELLKAVVERLPARRVPPARSSSSRTTTSWSPATWCRASTSGSTPRGAAWRRAAPAA